MLSFRWFILVADLHKQLRIFICFLRDLLTEHVSQQRVLLQNFALVIHTSTDQYFVSAWCYSWAFEQPQLFTSKCFYTLHFAHLKCQLGGVILLVLYHRFQLHHCWFFCCFCLLFLSLALQYILVFCICLVYHHNI